MPDELWAAAETITFGNYGAFDLPPREQRLWAAAQKMASAYLAAPPPLTRERLEKAMGELFAPADPRHFAAEDIVDGLCRLLGVDSP